MKHRGVIAGVLLGAGLLIFSGLAAVSIHVPWGRDQGVAAYVATVMAEGGAVYKDVYHFNLPGIFFAYRLALWLPLPPVTAVNLLHLVSVILTYLIVFLAARKIMDPVYAALAAVFYGAFAVVIYTAYWDMAQKESLAAPALALCLLFSLKTLKDGGPDSPEAEQRPSALLPAAFSGLAGLFAGLAAQFKPTLGIVLFAALYPAWRRRPSSAALLSASCLVGFGLSFVPLVIYLQRHEAFGAMLESVVKFGGFYGGQAYDGFGGTLSKIARNLLAWLYKWHFMAALGAAGLIALSKKSSAGFRLALGFGLLLLVQMITQMKFFTYHFIPLLIPCALLAARGAEFVLGGESDGTTKARRFALGLLVFALLIGNLGPHSKRYRREMLYDLGRIDRVTFLSAYGRWGVGDMCALASEAVAQYLKSHTRPEDPILIFGHEPGLYVMAERRAPTRFAYDQPLVTEPDGSRKFARYREQMREEFLSDLAGSPPRYIVVIENDQSPIKPEDSFTLMQKFTAFKELIDRDYFLETKIEDYYIFRRREAPFRGASP